MTINKKKILVACEFSGRVREAFRLRGHDAYSCDLLPTEIPGNHLQTDVLEILNDGWDMMIAFPPCTYLCLAGNKWMQEKFRERFPDRKLQREKAVEFFLKLVHAPIKQIAIENPRGIMSTLYRKPDQIIQPYHFADPYQKITCLWLKNIPKLERRKFDMPLFGQEVDRGEFMVSRRGHHVPVWYNSALSLDKEERAKVRSRTFPGIASAMAEQWG